MTKNQAHEYLNQLRNNQRTLSLLKTTAALQATGDLPRLGKFEELSGRTLRSNGNEPWIDRSCQAHGQEIQNDFSWSRYLDCGKTEGVTQ